MNLVHGEDNEVEESEEEIEFDDGDGEDESSEAGFSSEEIEDNPTYWEWYHQAVRDTQERRDKKYEKYINEDMLNEEDAKEKAHEKTLWLVKRIFFDRYATFLSLNLPLKNNETHQEIMDYLEEKKAWTWTNLSRRPWFNIKLNLISSFSTTKLMRRRRKKKWKVKVKRMKGKRTEDSDN